MNINFRKEILNMTDSPIKVEGSEDNFTIGTAAVNALLFSYEDESKISGEDKLKRYNLAKNIQVSMNEKEELETESKDIVFLKTYIGKFGYSPLIYGRCDEILEGK